MAPLAAMAVAGLNTPIALGTTFFRRSRSESVMIAFFTEQYILLQCYKDFLFSGGFFVRYIAPNSP
jgi:hypothetical protein